MSAITGATGNCRPGDRNKPKPDPRLARALRQNDEIVIERFDTRTGNLTDSSDQPIERKRAKLRARHENHGKVRKRFKREICLCLIPFLLRDR